MSDAPTSSPARDPAPTDLAPDRPMSIAVLLDLEPGPGAGGHVKTWERLTEAAARRADLDLTLHHLGPAPSSRTLGPRTRAVAHPARWSTRGLGLLAVTPDATDLAPNHPGVARALAGVDLVHTTDAYFAFARTAERWARRERGPLVTSLHTDVPGYTRVFTAEVVARALGGSSLARRVADASHLGALAGRWADRRLARHLAASRAVLASSPEDEARIASTPGAPPVSRLRRGVDRDLFHPARRDRARLDAELGAPRDAVVVLFVGRLDPTKRPDVVVHAVRAARARGAPVFAVLVGRGPLGPSLAAALGPAGRVLGPRSQRELGWLYASADLFALPGELELCPNVVLEARSAGLPVLVSAHGGSRQLVAEDGVDGAVIAARDAAAWADPVLELATNEARRRAMGAAARADVERRWPSWDEVLALDVLPAWRRALAR